MTATAELISKDELTAAKLLEIYQHAFFNASLDPDGDLMLTMEGLHIFPSVDPQRDLFRTRMAFGLKPNATRQQVLKLCNRINDGLIFIRACCPAAAQSQLLLDHYTDTAAGVTGLEVIDETRRFRSVLNGVSRLDTDDILK